MEKSAFLKRMSTLREASELTLRYFRWLYDACEKVDLLQITTPDLNQGFLIEEKDIMRYEMGEKETEFFKSLLKFVRINPIENKKCFQVASLACLSLTDVKYVEGYLEFPNATIEIEQAWNQYKDLFYFDLLAILSPKNPSPTYYKVLKMDKAELKQMLNEEKTSYPLMRAYYNNNVFSK